MWLKNILPENYSESPYTPYIIVLIALIVFGAKILAMYKDWKEISGHKKELSELQLIKLKLEINELSKEKLLEIIIPSQDVYAEVKTPFIKRIFYTLLGGSLGILTVLFGVITLGSLGIGVFGVLMVVIDLILGNAKDIGTFISMTVTGIVIAFTGYILSKYSYQGWKTYYYKK